MRLPAGAALIAALGVAPFAHAQNWTFPSSETMGVMLAIEARDGEVVDALVATRWPEAILVYRTRLDCASRTMTISEMGTLEASGAVSQLSPPPEPAETTPAEGAFAPVIEAACAAPAAPLERPTRGLEGVTPELALLGLHAEDRQMRETILEAVLGEPGGFPPLVIHHTAGALYEAGRQQEAFEWFAFALVRLTIDLRAAFPDEHSQLSATIAPAYAMDVLLELADAFMALPTERRVALSERALELDATLPRYYPVDWAAWPQFAQRGDWASARWPRPATDFAARERLGAARAEFAAEMRAAVAQ